MCDCLPVFCGLYLRYRSDTTNVTNSSHSGYCLARQMSQTPWEGLTRIWIWQDFNSVSIYKDYRFYNLKSFFYLSIIIQYLVILSTPTINKLCNNSCKLLDAQISKVFSYNSSIFSLKDKVLFYFGYKNQKHSQKISDYCSHMSHVVRKPVLPYANNKGTDQPAHLRRLISAFVVCWLDSIIPQHATTEISGV